MFERTGQEIDVRMWHISGNRVIHIKDRNGLLEVMTVNYDDTQIQSEQKKKKLNSAEKILCKLFIKD